MAERSEVDGGAVPVAERSEVDGIRSVQTGYMGNSLDRRHCTPTPILFRASPSEKEDESINPCRRGIFPVRAGSPNLLPPCALRRRLQSVGSPVG